jgi:hypothetical protein
MIDRLELTPSLPERNRDRSLKLKEPQNASTGYIQVRLDQDGSLLQGLFYQALELGYGARTFEQLPANILDQATSLWISGQFLFGGGENSFEADQDQVLHDPSADLLGTTSQVLALKLGDGCGNLGLHLAFGIGTRHIYRLTQTVTKVLWGTHDGVIILYLCNRG